MTAIGIISIDNYDDVIDKLDDKESSYLNTLITSVISDWASEHEVYYRRINAERHLFIAREADIEQMKTQKFDILATFKNKARERELLLTMSMGIAYGQASLKEIGEVAQDNLDLALI
ncbi:DHH family phosphoesterase, partial [Enterococcus cecorum]|nr:DHH family phosphoesterase [Enterococcus cecorum]